MIVRVDMTSAGSVKDVLAAKGNHPLIRLLFVINAPIVGGAELHTFDLARLLSHDNFESTIFSIHHGPLRPDRAVEFLAPERRRPVYLRVLDLAAAIERTKPDIVVAVCERPVVVAYAACRLAKSQAKIVAIPHTTLLRNRKERLLQLAYGPFYNRIESVVFISQNQRDFWLSRGFSPRHDTTILNGVDTQLFSPAVRERFGGETRRRLGLSDADVVFGISAAMRPEKNHVQLVDALARLRREGRPAKALFVGDGPMRPMIESRIAALGLTDHVTLVGMQEDVRPFVAAFDVGVLCSLSVETLSLAALEIMSMGVPMVMSDIGGASEILGRTLGQLFAAGDDENLHAALLRLTDAETRAAAGSAARAKVEAVFDQRKMVERYSEYFSGVRRDLGTVPFLPGASQRIS